VPGKAKINTIAFDCWVRWVTVRNLTFDRHLLKIISCS
jgi:hypothetical protein